jgi:hypothetical protein
MVPHTVDETEWTKEMVDRETLKDLIIRGSTFALAMTGLI